MHKNISVPEFIAIGGEMGELIRSKDWSKTCLGEPEYWPDSLKTSLSIILRSGYPMFIWWGKGLIMFHNDAYLPVLGQKHPHALGSSARDIWAEIWEDIGEVVADVFKGKHFYAKDMQLFLERKGFLEETYWTFSYSPIVDAGGNVAGLFCACNEETDKILRQRRLSTLKELSECNSSLSEAQTFASQAVKVLAGNTADLPFVALYLMRDQNGQACLANIGKSYMANEWLPEILPAEGTDLSSAWGIEKVIETGQPVLIDKLPTEPSPLCNDAKAAVVLPLRQSGVESIAGVLICGVSKTLELDEEYSSFFNLIAQQLSTGIRNAETIEEERRRAEALKELNKAKTDFFNNVSHEFRTPLTLILGPIEEALRNMEGDEEKTSWLKSLHRNTKRLQKLVTDLLEFSKIGSNKLQVKFAPADLSQLTAWLVGAFQSAIESSNIQFEVDCPPLSEPVYVDQNAWEKIVSNLISNAFKFTFEGHISASIKESADHVEFIVSDSGIGIAKKDQEKIFDRFHRVQGATSRTYEGTGIGLALVKELVTMHGGQVHVKSKLGKGTQMVVVMPKGKAHLPQGLIVEVPQEYGEIAASYIQETLHSLPAETPAAKPTNATNQNSHQKLVLVAEDNPDMRHYISRLLNQDYQVDTALNGKEAWQKIKHRLPDILITDVMMPEMDGFSLLHQIRSDKTTHLLPVIVLSARAGEEAIVEGLAQGADDYLVKPFSAIELLSRVRSTLRIEDSRRQAEISLRNILMQAPVAISILKGPDFVIDLINDLSLKNIDRKREEIINKPALEVFPELKDQGFLQIWQNVYRNGERFSANDVPVQIKIGEELVTRYADFVYEPLYDVFGKIEGIMSIGLDVTEKFIAKKKIQESHNYFQMMSDHVPAIIWVAKEDGHFSYLNKPWYNYTGFTKEMSEDFGWLEALHPDDRIQVEGVYRQAVKENRSFSVEARIKNRFGKYRWFEATGAARFDDRGDFQGFVGALVDITQQKKDNESLKMKVDELEQFAYVASHDLQEPLNTISSFVELIESEHKFDGELAECLGFIKESSARLTNLISDLLQHSRIGRGGKLQKTDLNKVVREVIADMKAKIDQERAIITFDDLPSLHVYPTEIRLLFQNLISNAVKFQRKEVIPTVHISALKKGSYWHMTIKDNGIGISPQYIDRIFVIFQRLHTSTEYSGTGIGLAHCKKIIDLHHGRIWVESEPGVGSKFHFTIPETI